jgi:hypothetical protein
MNRDDVVDGLREQYKDDILDAYHHCLVNQGQDFDHGKLVTKLNTLQKAAAKDGLEWDEFDSLVKASVPDVYDEFATSNGRHAA